MRKSRFGLDQSGSVAVHFVVALMRRTGVTAIVVDLVHADVARRETQKAAEAGVNAGVRALALADSTSFPKWNNALATAKAMVPRDFAAGTLLNDCQADNSLQKIQTGFWDLSWAKDTAPANLKGHLDVAGYDAATSVAALLETPLPTTIPNNSPVLPLATPQSPVNSYLNSRETFNLARTGWHRNPGRYLFFQAG